MSDLIITNVTQGNIKNISITLPHDQLIVLTGVSGSGKSTLAMDVIFQECQRQVLQTMSFQGIHKPKVEKMQHVRFAICISQSTHNLNPRSTVGTVSDIYTELRMIYEKLSLRVCPFCHEVMQPWQCKEETEKKGEEFIVYQFCNHCNKKLRKLTRTEFSYNTTQGACPTCQGLGKILELQLNKIVDETKSVKEGALLPWKYRYLDYQLENLKKALEYYELEYQEDVALQDWPMLAKEIVLQGVLSQEIQQAFKHKKIPKTLAQGRFEGLIPQLHRKLVDKQELSPDFFEETTCPSCNGERLNQDSRIVTIQGLRLPQLANLSLDELLQWVKSLNTSCTPKQKEHVQAYLFDLEMKLQRLIKVGLGYLCCNRQTMSLSGGESQRMKLAAALDSDLNGVLYILDEPTQGLHCQDTEGMISILKTLRDQGNTVLVIEHDLDVIAQADYIVDMGLNAGCFGGEIVMEGTYQDLLAHPISKTAQFALRKPYLKQQVRPKNNLISITHATLHNLQDVSVDFPTDLFCCVTGVSGSGKSTLIFDVLAQGQKDQRENKVEGLAYFDQIILVQQESLTRQKRSNVATYCQVYTKIRELFAKLTQSKQAGYCSSDFSFNTPGGRCEHCEGLGVITSNLLFFADVEVVCPICKGQRFKEHLLSVQWQGLSISDVLNLSIDRAMDYFKEEPSILEELALLAKVGLGYLVLGQTLTTLSAGEGQRLKLAKQLSQNQGKRILYLIDEPTAGLHPSDIDNFISLANELVDQGHSVIVVEHNPQLIRQCDWIVDLGPQGGIYGGQVIAQGTPQEIAKNPSSITGRYLMRQ